MGGLDGVVEFFEFFREEFGVKIVYKKGKRDILFFKPSTYPPKERGKFFYTIKGTKINLRRLFVDAKGEFKLPSSYRKIKERIYNALPQFFRTMFTFLYYAFEEEFPRTPRPFAEMRVFVYHKIPSEYKTSPQLAEIEEHLSFLASTDAERNHSDWGYTIDAESPDSSHPVEEQDTPLTPEDMKDEAKSKDGLVVGGIKALRYVHRHVLYLTAKGKVKGEYMEDYWQNSELKYLGNPLQNKLEHEKGQLIPKDVRRTYEPKYPLWFGLKWK